MGELVIEQQSTTRKRFRGKSPTEVWVGQRQVWHRTEEDFAVHCRVRTLQTGESVEFRGATGSVRAAQPEGAWVLSDTPIVTTPEDFDYTVWLAAEASLMDLHVFNEMLWVSTPEPVYQLVETDTEVLVTVPGVVNPDARTYGAFDEAEALEDARRIARRREVVQLERIETADVALSPRAVAQVRAPHHPVAKLVTARLPEMTDSIEKLQEALRDVDLPASDLVAQLSAIATASRRLLDDARTLNNDPNAR